MGEELKPYVTVAKMHGEWHRPSHGNSETPESALKDWVLSAFGVHMEPDEAKEFVRKSDDVDVVLVYPVHRGGAKGTVEYEEY